MIMSKKEKKKYELIIRKYSICAYSNIRFNRTVKIAKSEFTWDVYNSTDTFDTSLQKKYYKC